MKLGGKNVILGVTGGVAAYKAAELLRLLVKSGAQVDVVMTESAQKFIQPLTFQALSGRPIRTSLWDTFDDGMDHIHLTRQADLLIIAPATANFIAKVANGQADDLLTTLCLASVCPMMIAPAMNHKMWLNSITRHNITRLQDHGFLILNPDEGEQACGENGTGRIKSPEEIFETISQMLLPVEKYFQHQKILLTAGPTFEPIDPVRGITNLSTGRMGYALAEAFLSEGAEVTLISGPTHLSVSGKIERVNVTTASEMSDEVMRRVKDVDIFVSVAAVSDYRPVSYSEQKIKKTKDVLTLSLEKNPDILAKVAALDRPPFCVGFAAESHLLSEHAKEKMLRKKVPLMVGNYVEDSLGKQTTKVVLFDKAGEHCLEEGTKSEVAKKIIQHIAGLLK